jgi:hypothetical protein
MSDDLVKRLRSPINAMRPTLSDGRAAADLIEELEAKAMKASNAAFLEKRRADEAEARVKELDAEIAKWRAAFIAQSRKLQGEPS